MILKKTSYFFDKGIITSWHSTFQQHKPAEITVAKSLLATNRVPSFVVMSNRNASWFQWSAINS